MDIKKLGLFIYLLPFCAVGSSSKTDSLEIALRACKPDTQKVNVLRMLSSEYRQLDTALSWAYASQSLELAKQLKFNRGIGSAYLRMASLRRGQGKFRAAHEFYGLAIALFEKEQYKKGLMIANYERAGAYRQEGHYDEAFNCYKTSRQLAEELKDQKYLAESTGGFANIYRYKGDYVNSLKYYLEAVAIAEKAGEKAVLGGLLNNMAMIYSYQGDLKEELKIRERAFNIYVELGDSINMVLGLNNLGAQYKDMGDNKKSLEMINRSLEIIKILGEEKVGYKYVSQSYEQAGKIALEQHDFPKALEHYKKARDLMIAGKDKKGISNSWGDLGSVYVEMKQWGQAEMCMYKQLSIAEEIGYTRGVMESCRELASILSVKGDYKEAFAYQEKYIDLKDSLLNEESAKQLAEMSAKYESEKKEQELEMKNLELNSKNEEVRKRTWILTGFAFTTLIFIVLAVFAYRQFRLKKKAMIIQELQNREILAKSDEILVQKEIIEAKNKDITDSILYAKHIQQAILPPEDYVLQVMKECFIFYRPRDIVSGDFYWVKEKEDEVLFSVIDCTGHGVPGAFMSVMAHSAINSVVGKHDNIKPASILNYLHHEMQENFRHQYYEADVNDGMDIALCSLNRKQGKLRFAGARIPLILVRNGDLTEIRGDKQTIDAKSQTTCEPFTPHEVDVQKGDTLYLFSDGFADQFGGMKGKKFKYAQLKELIRSIAQTPVFKQRQVLEKVIDEWKGNLEQVDDILVMGIRV